MFPRLLAALAVVGLGAVALPTGRHEQPLPGEVDSDETRRVLGSSVVTSVSVIMDLGHGGTALLSSGQHDDSVVGGSQQSEAFANSAMPTLKRPVGSPPALMSPDRYEFYTFDESGELVRRLMTLEQIQSLIAGGDDADRLANPSVDVDTANTQPSAGGDPQREVVANVQQVLKEELQNSMHRNGTEPLQGEFEPEADVQEVPSEEEEEFPALVQEVPAPPSSSQRPEQGDASQPLPDDSLGDSDAASLENEDSSSSLPSGEGAQMSEDESSQPSANDSSDGEESADSGVSSESSASQDDTKTSSEEHGDHEDSSIHDSSTDVSLEEVTTPSEFVSEKYGIYHISVTHKPPSVMDDFEDSTSANMEDKTTLKAQTVNLEEESASTEYMEVPSKNETQVKDHASFGDTSGQDEVSEDVTEESTTSHGHTTPPPDSTDDAELTNKNPPGIHHDESISGPIPEVEVMPNYPGQDDDTSVSDQDGNFGATTQMTGEPIYHNTQSSDHQPDEIPNHSQTTEFQPPEEADLTQFYNEGNQNVSNASDEKEENPMTVPGLPELFELLDKITDNKDQTLMSIADSLNEEESLETTTTERENLAYQGEVEDNNQSEIAEPSASLLPPLIDDEDVSTTVHTGEEQYQSTEVSIMKDKDTRPLEEDEYDSDEIASQFSNSEDSTSKKPFDTTVSHSAQEATSDEDIEKNTTPAPDSIVEVLSPETSTHVPVTSQNDMVPTGEGSVMTDEVNGSASKKPEHGDRFTSISSSSTESLTQSNPVTYEMTSTDSTTMPSMIVDVVTDNAAGESHEHQADISQPIKEDEPVESGDRYTTITPDGGALTLNIGISGGTGDSMGVGTHEGEKTSGEDVNEDSDGSLIEDTVNSGADERFESSTSTNSDGEGYEATATTRRSELEGESHADDGAERVTDVAGKDKYVSDSVTTETINLEVSSEKTPENVGSLAIKESATHKTTEIMPEHTAVGTSEQSTKSTVDKTDEDYLLGEMHKVAEEQSDPLLSPYDEQTEEIKSALKDKPTPVASNDDENETAEGTTEPTSDNQESDHSTTEVIAEAEGDAPTTASFAQQEVASSTPTHHEEEVKPIASQDEDPSTDSVTQIAISHSSEEKQPSEATSVDATTYRPVYIPLGGAVSDGLSDAAPSVSPDDLPDPNGLSGPLLGSQTNKPTAEPPTSVSPGLASHVPPLMPAFPPAPSGNMGLEATSSSLDPDVKLFVDLCNDLAFSLYSQVTGASQSIPNIRGTHGSGVQTRSLVLSPFAISSLLAMVFLGARGPTSEQMNDLLHLDDVVTFNPHLVLQNVTESVITSPGVSAAAFVRELYSDKSKGHLLEFYKQRAKAFYEGHVEEVDFAEVNDVIRRRTNHLVRWQTRGRVPEYLRGSSLRLRPPLAALSANFFEADCQRASSVDTDGEMYFEVPAMGRRRRRLVPVPAVVWRGVFLAGFDPGLDATALELRHGGGEVSTVLVLPGRHGHSVPDEPSGGLSRLEAWLSKGGKASWSSLLRSAVPRGPIEVQLPRFAHRSVLNVTGALTRMGLADLFTGGKADLRGLDGSIGGTLHLSDAIQMTAFGVCAEDGNSRRHLETYPSAQRTGRSEGSEEVEEEYASSAEAQQATEEMPTERTTEAVADSTTDRESSAAEAAPRDGRAAAWGDLDVQSYAFAAAEAARDLPLALRPRQARIPKPTAVSLLPRLRFDRPFLYFVRHNPSGFILLMGRFNPRLFP
ncbi:uncharacterized protein LOC124156608 [Ischnura elegans]|uniref:uncharacterized protein LOC124156608 n=1 Tax=Ischnura elegans TaxID=197161 RepID=UPI001ED88923|nr:uncharacterized protein LOC124156608 [Ischnura elegans]